MEKIAIIIYPVDIYIGHALVTLAAVGFLVWVGCADVEQDCHVSQLSMKVIP